MQLWRKECSMRCLLAFSLLCALAFPAEPSDIRGGEVQYSVGGTVMKGYLAYDAGYSAKRPGILVVHEWWGLNEYARNRARMLAELGYTALAVDMYGDGRQAAHPEDAKAFSSAVMKNVDVARARFLAALDVLTESPTVDPRRIGAIGYCFGGAVVLQMAREGVDLRGVVSFHGNLTTQRPAKPGVVRAKIFVAHGAADQFMSPEQIENFMEEMKSAGADVRFVSYEGAKHSFTNPDADLYAKKFSIPLAYSPAADRQSWEDMKEFFNGIFSLPPP